MASGVTTTSNNSICPRIDFDPLITTTFALGWFWGPERTFRRVDGVVDVICVYIGGETINPTYQSIGDHTEGVTITFDEKKISFGDLVEFFFSKANLTESCSRSKQYQTGIWWHNDEQKKIVNEKIRLLEEKNNWNIQIHRGPVTESGIYKAEEYHQRFFEKNPGSAW
jgi:methionine-S-sulfoxide reductase